MAVAYSKVNSFVEAMAEKAHNLGADQLVVALTNTAHTSTWTQLSDLTQVSYTNLSSRNITTSTSAQTAGTYKLVLTDLVLTASGSVGPFRYVYIYNDTATNDELVGYYDYGASITLTTSGETFTCDFDGTNGVLQIA